ncbi:MAG: hypothetical protein QXK80_03165 [Candidatus Pacearchaeota archaeon]
MLDYRIEVENTKSTINEINKEDFELTFKISLPKQNYLSNIKKFFETRKENNPFLKKSCSEEIKKYEKCVEEKYFEEVKDVLLQRLILSDFYIELKEEFDEEKNEKNLLVNIKRENFDSFFKLSFLMPRIETKKSIFGSSIKKVSLPDLIYYYTLSGTGDPTAVDKIKDEYAREVPIAKEFKNYFINGEWIKIKDVQLTEENFKIEVVGKIMFEIYYSEQLKQKSPNLSDLNALLFEEKKQSLLTKLAFDNNLSHKVEIRKNEMETIVKSRNKDFEAKIILAPNADFLPLFLSFYYSIHGNGKNFHTFLKEYWPSTE